MNVERMKQLAATARAVELNGLEAGIDNIGEIQMATFLDKDRPVQCGYTACLCGLSAAMFRPKTWDAYVSCVEDDDSCCDKFRDENGEMQSLLTIAQEDLGISHSLAYSLFVHNYDLSAEAAIRELEKAINEYQADPDSISV